jgi:protein-S-isoprenylcysteine O-methyltransferase Ste14
MYIGVIIMLFGVPLALGSWWGLLTVIPIIIVIVSRLLDEEKYLEKGLAGYPKYQSKVKYRLLPFIW